MRDLRPRRMLRAFIDWGVLLEMDEKHVYLGATKHVFYKMARSSSD